MPLTFQEYWIHPNCFKSLSYDYRQMDVQSLGLSRRRVLQDEFEASVFRRRLKTRSNVPQSIPSSLALSVGARR